MIRDDLIHRIVNKKGDKTNGFQEFKTILFFG